MDASTRSMVEDAYHETAAEALGRSESKIEAHKEGVTAAAMLLVSLGGFAEEEAHGAVVALNLRPET